MLPHVSALIVGHQLRLKHVGALTNKKIVQQVGVKFYICNMAAWIMYNIKYK